MDQKVVLNKVLFWSLGLLCLGLSFGLGCMISYSSWDEEISIARHKAPFSRGLASEGEGLEVRTVPSDVYLDSQTLFREARQTSDSDQVLFYIGNIISRDSMGNKNFVCDMYSQVYFYFEADGIFHAGEPVTMTLYSSCKTDETHRFIGPFSIPVKEISNSPLSQKSFSNESDEILFSNAHLSWPRAWILRRVVFQSASQEPYRVEAQIPQSEEEKFFTIEF